MKTKPAFSLALIMSFFVLSSCSSVLNEIIDVQKIKEDAITIKDKYPDLDSMKIRILDNLLALSQNRNEYVKFYDEQMKGLDFSMEKYIVNDEKFNEIKEKTFNYLKAQEITYKIFFTEVDSMKAISDRFDRQNEILYKQIDDFCIKKQTEIDEREKNADKIRNELNQMVDLKVIGITDREYDYRDVIEVKVQMTNKTNKPIEAISFRLDLTDKLGTRITSLNCKTNDSFIKSDIGTWQYDRWDNSEVYKALKNVKISHISSQQTINIINHNGKIISAYDGVRDFVINLDYTTPKKLSGYCPYLEDEDDLKIRIKEMEEKEEALGFDQTPAP